MNTNYYWVVFADTKNSLVEKYSFQDKYLSNIFSFSEFLEEFRKNQKSWEI